MPVIGPYDRPEMDILQRMINDIIRDYLWDEDDFRGMSFNEVEYLYLEELGYEDFR